MMLTQENIDLILLLQNYRTLTKVAEVMFISQSAISKRIQNIEDELGYKVFARGRGRKVIELTPRGAELIPLLYQMRELDSKMLGLKYHEQRPKLRIASSDGPYLTAVDAVVETLSRQDRSWVFKLKLMSYQECINAVDREIVDMALVGNHIYQKGLNLRPLYREPMCLIARRGRFPDRALDISELDINEAVYSAYSTEFSSWFHSAFKNGPPMIQCDLLLEVKRYILSMGLWSIVPLSVIRYFDHTGSDLAVYDLRANIPERTIYYAIKDYRPNELCRIFLKELQKELSKIPGISFYGKNYVD